MAITRAEPLHGQIYEILWEKILAGEVAPGQRLSDVDWSVRLSVSRTPVREAMRKLEQDGILLPLAHGGYELRRIKADDLHNLYRCRAVLEALAVREAGARFTAADAERLRALIRRTEALIARREFDPVFELNTQFHEQIIGLAQNPYLVTLIRNLRRLILLARSSVRNVLNQAPGLVDAYAEHLQHTQDDHHKIVDLLEAKKVEQATRVMERHLFRTADDMRKLAQAADP